MIRGTVQFKRTGPRRSGDGPIAQLGRAPPLGLRNCTPANARRGPRVRSLRATCAISTPARSISPFSVSSLRRGVAVLLFLTLLLSGAAARTDPATGRVRILFMGEVASTNDLFLGWLNAEPQFVFTRVPLDVEWITLKEAKRFARIYLPRSKRDLEGAYDVTVFEDYSPDVLPLDILEWFQAAISEGMGIALIEYVNWGGTNDIQKWMDLQFYEVFPAEIVMNDIQASQGRTFYEVQNEDGLLDIPGIEGVPLNRGHHGDMVAREGATVEAIWKGRRTPSLVTSSYGQGHTLQLAHGWDNIPDEPRLHYGYLMDFIFNQVLYIADLEFPEDLELVHSLRTLFVNYEDRREATLSVLDFVQRFGANPEGAMEMLGSMRERHEEASRMYLTQDYEGARSLLLPLMDEFSLIDRELMRAKDRALMWIYIIEWTSVSAAFMVTSTILWTLMVRRRLYRDVGTTRGV